MSAKFLLAGAALLVAAPALASHPKLQTIYQFTGANGDGAVPEDTPSAGEGGLLYGTTIVGGASNNGAVYSLNTATGAETPLYSFAGGKDGAQPQSGVIYHAGVLYGTTYEGGTGKDPRCQGNGCGTVFRIATASGKETVLHSFAARGDGRTPSGGKLVLVGGALYGTTEYGGARDLGTVYRVDQETGATTILHSFMGGTDGKRPQGGLLALGSLLYGTAFEGGGRGCDFSCGALFSIDPATGAETVLHAFIHPTGGQYPFGGLTSDGQVIYGTLYLGGRAGHGAVYQYDLTSNTETVLHNFVRGTDGGAPVGVTFYNGQLYGGTLVGGAYELGVAYRLDPATRREIVFHQFTGGADGGLAYGSPAVVGGALYGTTYQGGNFQACPDMGCGTIFRISP